MSHFVHDRRSLVMHRLIARRLRRDPSLREGARRNIQRWSANPSVSESSLVAMREWLPLLEGPMEALLSTMTGTDENGSRLRQSSPFAGEAFLKQQERMRVLRRVRR